MAAKVPSPVESEQGRVLVIGAGVAGIRAAIDLAEVGCSVVIVDSAPAMGGLLSKLDHQFPNDHCGMCRMLPEIGPLRSSRLCLRKGLFHDSLRVHLNTSICDVRGEPGSLEVDLLSHPSFIDSTRCGDCPDLCVEACPVTALDDFNEGLTQRKAIYRPVPIGLGNTLRIDPGACDHCGACVEVCPVGAIDLQAPEKTFTINVDAVILAVGTSLFRPEGQPGWDDLPASPAVMTALQFERFLGLAGPRRTQLLRPGDGKSIRHIAWLQCVGSRDRKHDRDVCSTVCCMFALKQARLVRDIAGGGIRATIFYMDMRGTGKDFHRNRVATEKKGVELIRSRVREVSPSASGGYRVRCHDEASGCMIQKEVDLLVLSTGQLPAEGIASLGAKLDLSLGEGSYVPTIGLDPVKTPSAGVFVCGTCSRPADIATSITEASAAAGQVTNLLRSLGRCVGTGAAKEPNSTEVPQSLERRVLIVGAGLAGLRAAVSLAQREIEVDLVEVEGELGGRFSRQPSDGSELTSLLSVLEQQVKTSAWIHMHLRANVQASRLRNGHRDTLLKLSDGQERWIRHGATILATGTRAATTTSYRLGQSDRILSQEGLETLLSKGEMGDLGVVVMIQCVDSRESGTRDYCSRGCCPRALEHAARIQVLHPEARIFVLYRDMMTCGHQERRFTEARRSGVIFISYDVDDKPRVDLVDGKPVVRVRDPILGQEISLRADWVVLSTGIEPVESSSSVAQVFGVECDGHGFYREADAKWRPVDLTIDGVYGAGTALSPGMVPQVLAQAEAAAQRAFERIARPAEEVIHGVAEVRRALCARCGACVEACVYQARILEEDRGIEVDPWACRRCGACVTACPNGAARLPGKCELQMMAQIDAALVDGPQREGRS